MPNHESLQKPLLRDQRRALLAYEVVGKVKKEQQGDYKNAVEAFGGNILRSGLCAALAAIQRLGDRGEGLLGNLAAASVPGLEGATAKNLAQKVRELEAEKYMIATREMLQIAVWLKRAAQATTEGV